MPFHIGPVEIILAVLVAGLGGFFWYLIFRALWKYVSRER